MIDRTAGRSAIDSEIRCALRPCELPGPTIGKSSRGKLFQLIGQLSRIEIDMFLMFSRNFLAEDIRQNTRPGLYLASGGADKATVWSGCTAGNPGRL